MFNYLPNKSIDDIFVKYDFDTHYGTLNSEKLVKIDNNYEKIQDISIIFNVFFLISIIVTCIYQTTSTVNLSLNSSFYILLFFYFVFLLFLNFYFKINPFNKNKRYDNISFSSFISEKYKKNLCNGLPVILVNLSIFFFNNSSKYADMFFLKLESIQENIKSNNLKYTYSDAVIFNDMTFPIFYFFYMKETNQFPTNMIPNINHKSHLLDYLMVFEKHLNKKSKFIDGVQLSIIIHEKEKIEMEIIDLVPNNKELETYYLKINKLFKKIRLI